MLINTILEGIRSGKRELEAIPLDDYTIGFEFEVAVRASDDSDESFIDDDGEFDEQSAMSNAFDQYSEDWMENDFPRFFDDVIDNNYRHHMSELARELDIEPVNGKPKSLDEVIEFEIANGNYPHLDVDKTMDLIQKYPMDTEYSDITLDDLVDISEFVYIDMLERTDVSRQDIIKKINDFKETDPDRLESVFNSQLSMVHSRLNLPEFDNLDSFVYDPDGEIIDLDDHVNPVDVDKFCEIFGLERSEFVTMTDYIWQDAMSMTMVEDFDDWWMRNRDSYMHSNSPIQVVSSILDEEFPDYVNEGWRIVPDGTDGVDAEIVMTRPYPVSEGFDRMHKVFDIIDKSPQIYTSKPTGLHVNIGTFNKSEVMKIDWLKFLVLANAKRMLSDFGRGNNHFATDQLPNLVSSLKTNDLTEYHDNLISINSHIINTATKMSAINLSKLNNYGYFEVRAPGNAGYETKGKKIEEYVKLIIHALMIASDPNKYKNQYISKLYKLFNFETRTQTIKKSPSLQYFDDIGTSSHMYNNKKPIITISIMNDTYGNVLDAKEANRLLTADAFREISDDVNKNIQKIQQEEPDMIDIWLQNYNKFSSNMKGLLIVQMITRKLQQAQSSFS